MTKQVVVIIAFVLLLSTIAGCTMTNNINKHDAFLENYLAAYKNNSSANTNLQIDTWEVTWINSTSAHVESSALNTSANLTVAAVDTFSLFPTTQDATNRLNAMNKTAYRVVTTETPQEGAYQNITGHAPQIYKQYIYDEGDPSNISEYTRHEITQLDNIISIYTEKIFS